MFVSVHMFTTVKQTDGDSTEGAFVPVASHLFT